MDRTSRPTGTASTRRKLLLDPYAKAIGRDLKWDDSLFGYQLDHAEKDLTFDERNSMQVRPARRRR